METTQDVPVWSRWSDDIITHLSHWPLLRTPQIQIQIPTFTSEPIGQQQPKQQGKITITPTPRLKTTTLSYSFTDRIPETMNSQRLFIFTCITVYTVGQFVSVDQPQWRGSKKKKKKTGTETCVGVSPQAPRLPGWLEFPTSLHRFEPHNRTYFSFPPWATT